ncbi:phage major capsid protein [Gammaproteobacteria bacterium]|nr:phage major capsid protein [Gammaproteobacteria bacterium]
MNNEQTVELKVRGTDSYEAVISSEYPVLRGEYEEVLIHSTESIDDSRFPLPLLINHNPENQIGVVENIRLEDKKLVGEVRFTNDDLGKMYEADVIDKVRNNLSIGYQVIKSAIRDGIKEVSEFLIHEVSIVPVPADPNATFRATEFNNFFTRNMNMEEQKLSRSEAKKLREEIVEIRALGSKHNLSDMADDFIANGNSLEQFRSALLEKITNKEPLDTPDVASYVRNIKQPEYSVVRAIEGIEDVSKRGYEWEVSKDLERSMPKTNPNSVILDLRTMTSAGAGASTIQTTVDQSIQDFIQAKSVMANVNAQRFNSLVGDLQIPIGSSASGATVIATDGTTQSAETTPTLTSKTLSPTRIADVIPLSYGLLQQSSPDVESYIRRLIGNTFANTFDDQIIGGSGTGGNVEGILNTTGINTVSNGGTEVTFANWVSAISELGADNIDLSNLRIICNPANIDNLVTAVKYASTASPILDMKAEDGGKIGEVLGYPVYATTKIAADNYIIGDFTQLAIANWGGLEIAKNDFYDDRRFISSLNAIMSFDAKVLQATAMCHITKA